MMEGGGDGGVWKGVKGWSIGVEGRRGWKEGLEYKNYKI